MKKILDKIVSITLAFIGLMFVVLMLLLMFKPEYAENLDNQLVHVLIIIFTVIFGILTSLNIFAAFSDADKINSVLLFKGKESATKATVSVVKRTAKNATKQVEGAKIKRVSLYVDENNDVKMKIELKVKSEDIEDIVTRVRATVVSTFNDVLGLEFAAIDFKLVTVKNQFKPDANKVDAKIAEFKKEQEEERAEKAREEASRQAKLNATKQLLKKDEQTDLADDDVVLLDLDATSDDTDDVSADESLVLASDDDIVGSEFVTTIVADDEETDIAANESDVNISDIDVDTDSDNQEQSEQDTDTADTEQD